MKKIMILLIIILIAIQFIPIDKTNPPIDAKSNLSAPDEVMTILKNSCYDCHSNETIWPSYSAIAPFSLIIAGHIKDGRKALNFSNWANIAPDIKVKRIERSIKTINNNMMPTPGYVRLHEDAVLSDEQKRIVVDWFEEELKR